MKNILVINSGSTSLKYKLFDENEKELKSGKLVDVVETEKAVKSILKEIGGLENLIAVGHRVVHGGDKFHKPVLLSDEIIGELEKFNELAPLHNPYNLAGIKAVQGFLPAVPQFAVFDTAFYFDLPEVAKTYAIPKNLAEKYKIRRFGFHGISHEYAMQEAAYALTPNPSPASAAKRERGARFGKKEIMSCPCNLITCHLGGGWSVTAIKNGKPVDTSMGWTPMEGLIMMTRPGDIDAGIVVELIKNSSMDEVYNLLNHESGIKGLTGLDNFQDVLKETSFGYKDAKLAFDLAVYKLVKYIGSYWAVLDGHVDAIVFTGAIGAGNPMTRNAVMKKLKFLGDVPMIVVKTDEELAIMRKIGKLLNL
jgi:acetate kinase